MTPTAAPVLFDRTLAARAAAPRAARSGRRHSCSIASADDMAERLHAVLRDFATGADIGTPGPQLLRSVEPAASVALSAIESR